MNALLTHSERVAIARLHALLELLPTALDKRLGPAGVTAFEHTLLEALAETDEHRMRLSALAAKTNATLPRISRVTSSLERRGLIRRAPCPADGRATNAVLTERGVEAHDRSSALYAAAVRELILDGLDTLPENGVSQLADLAYAILGSLDPNAPGGRAGSAPATEPDPKACPADPAAVPADAGCPADPPAPSLG